MPPENTSDSTFSSNKPAFSKKSKGSLYKIIGGAVLALIVILFTVGYLANSSVPGDRLYSFKTNVLQKFFSTAQITDKGSLSYNVTLLESRLTELQALHDDTDSSTPETLTALADLMKTHTTDSVTILKENTAMSFEEKITSLLSISNTNLAAETLADDFEEFEPIVANLDEISVISKDALKETIDQFASDPQNEEAIQTYIGEQITKIGDEINNVAPNSDAQKRAITRITYAGEEIADKKFANALLFLIQGRQGIAIDSYLYAAEKESDSSPAYDPGEIPEGS